MKDDSPKLYRREAAKRTRPEVAKNQKPCGNQSPSQSDRRIQQPFLSSAPPRNEMEGRKKGGAGQQDSCQITSGRAKRGNRLSGNDLAGAEVRSGSKDRLARSEVTTEPIAKRGRQRGLGCGGSGVCLENRAEPAKFQAQKTSMKAPKIFSTNQFARPYLMAVKPPASMQALRRSVRDCEASGFESYQL